MVCHCVCVLIGWTESHRSFFSKFDAEDDHTNRNPSGQQTVTRAAVRVYFLGVGIYSPISGIRFSITLSSWRRTAASSCGTSTTTPRRRPWTRGSGSFSERGSNTTSPRPWTTSSELRGPPPRKRRTLLRNIRIRGWVVSSDVRFASLLFYPLRCYPRGKATW